MTTSRQIQVLVLFFLLVIASFWMAACRTYKWSAKPPIDLQEIMEPWDKPMVVYLSNSGKTHHWLVALSSVDSETFKGEIISMGLGNPVIRGSKDKRLSQRHIRITMATPKLDTLLKSGSFILPVSAVTKIEEYQYDEVGSIILTTILLTPVFAFLVFLMAKGTSCPFVYSGNGDHAVFEGEIFSGATRPNMERDDWLPLRHLEPREGRYEVQITNEVKEIQHTDLAELVVVDHPVGIKVLFDKYGVIHSIGEPKLPDQAVDRNGRDILPLIQSQDSLRFMTSDAGGTPDGLEWVDLTFTRPAGAEKAKLIIRAKNSMWLDLAFGLFMDEQGIYAQKIKEEGLKKSRAESEAWMRDQHIPLEVLIETSPGNFTSVDWYHLAGPMAVREDLLMLDLSKVQGDQIRLRLQAGFMFWEIDQVFIDYMPDQVVSVQTLQAEEAMDQRGISQREALRFDDGSYYDQPEIGDAVTMVFREPEQVPGSIRSAFLHARGHYEILREPSNRRPSKAYLTEFRKPGRFTRFALEQYQWLNRQGYTFSPSASR